MDDVAKDFHELAVQVARLDERTGSLMESVRELRESMRELRGEGRQEIQSVRQEIRDVRSEMRWLFGGLSVLVTIGLTVLGLVLKLT